MYLGYFIGKLYVIVKKVEYFSKKDIFVFIFYYLLIFNVFNCKI